MDPVVGAGGAQVAVVVGVLEVGLQQVVVDVLGRQVSLDPVDAECFEFEHRHGAGGVLQQGVVDFYGDFLAGAQLTFDQVGGNDLLCQISGHIQLLQLLSSNGQRR
jgi:hypothetical protein